MNREDTNVRKMLASVYFNAGITDEAIAQYLEILSLNPKDAAALADLAKCYLKTEQYKEAIRISERAVKVDPRDDQSMVNIALAWSHMQDWNKAIAAYQNALKSDPIIPWRFSSLGRFTRKRGSSPRLWNSIVWLWKRSRRPITWLWPLPIFI